MNAQTRLSHPLEPVVTAIVERLGAVDASRLGTELSGGYLTGKRSSSENNAYRLVATDALECMEGRGLLSRDEFGWYRLAESRATNPPIVV
jgi:hypothetical protein